MTIHTPRIYLPLVACLGLIALSSPSLVHSAEVLSFEQAFFECKQRYPSDVDADKRLACFDRIERPQSAMGGNQTLVPVDVAAPAATTTEMQPDEVVAQESKPKDVTAKEIVPKTSAKTKQGFFGRSIEAPATPLSFLERKWRLNSTEDWDISDLETHRLNYIAVVNTNDTNNVAATASRPNNVSRNLDHNDVKFQLSLKTELMHNLPIVRDLPWVTSSRIWAAYTQQSYWQVFNGDESRPIRESNYSPEIIMSLGLNDEINGKHYGVIPRMVNLGIMHESNGRSQPISRSWNRVYLESAWQLNDAYTLSVRPWWRIPEKASEDDNPDIEKYMGFGDMTLRWDNYAKNTAASLLVRNNFRSDNKGYAKFDVYYQPFKRDNIKLYMMLSNGYGESLVDYNHSQTMFGLGFAIGE